MKIDDLFVSKTNNITIRELETQIILNILKRAFVELNKTDKHYDINYCSDYMKKLVKKNNVTKDSVTGKIITRVLDNIKKQNKNDKKFNVIKYLEKEIADLETIDNESDMDEDELTEDENESMDDDFINDDTLSDDSSSSDEDYTTEDELLDTYLVGSRDEKKIDFIKQRYFGINSLRKEVKYFNNLEDDEKDNVVEKLTELNNINLSNKPLVFRVLDSNMSIENKAKVIDKIKKMEEDESGSGENQKMDMWIESLLNIPFGIYSTNDKFLNLSSSETKKIIQEGKECLDNAIYGHNDAKRKILQILAQNIKNPNTNGVVYGIQGPIGNGKTTLIKEGLAKILNKPFTFISLGGATDGSYLDGHSYTYEGSIWGKLVDLLMNSKCMNPVIYFDELDKVSETYKGDEIINILIHLTDPSQNAHFTDKYFHGISFDLSKATIIFSYNDYYKINPVLRDRIENIKTKNLKLHEKVVIGKDYLLPKIFNDIGIKHNKIIIPDELIEFIVEHYTNEGGVRKIKELLYDIIREYNLRMLLGDKLPKRITKTAITNDLFKKRPILKRTMIKNEPLIGYVNGLYASVNSQGGITCIEAKMIPTDSILQLKLTGQQGDVMKESMNVALTVAWNIIPEKTRSNWLKKWKTSGNMGFHIHCPEGATPKDGPSAGLAITLALISLLTETPVKNTIALTGEIDLNGNALEIGGLEDKILGGKMAGVKKILCPYSNKKDIELILEDNHNDLTNIEIKTIKTIEDVMEECLVNNTQNISKKNTYK